MKVVSIRASVNVIILVSILLINALFSSELRDTVSFNSINFVLAVIFVFLNFRFNPFLFIAFMIPIFFLSMSLIVNRDITSIGGYHTALSIMVSYLLLTLKPFPLNRILMKHVVYVYMLIALIFSIICSSECISFTNVLNSVANKNFNINPNSAAIFFLSCLVLSRIFIKGRLRWFYVVAFGILILTTASRTGCCVAAILIVGFAFFEDTTISSFNWHLLFSKKVLRYMLMLSIIAILVYILIPTSYSMFSKRLSVSGFELASKGSGLGRDEIWAIALKMTGDSLDTILFGAGFGEVMERLNIGMHSSYVAAIVSAGWLFLVATLLSVYCLLFYHKKNGQNAFFLYAVSILIYGAFETVLFNGLESLWWIFIFLSLYYRSFESYPIAQKIRF